MEQIIITFKDYSYLIFKHKLESYNTFYDRAWQIVKKEPKNKADYDKALIEVEMNLNVLNKGYVY